jgi:hypothetical protein
MSHRLIAALAFFTCFCLFSLSQISAADQPDPPDFSGDWTLDVPSSNPIDPLMKQIGASLLDRTYAALARFKVTLLQTGDKLAIATRAPGFALDQTLYLDGRTDRDNVELFGATSVSAKTTWFKDHKELVEIHQIKTKQGKDGQLIIERSLTDQAKTMMVVLTLEVNHQPEKTVARQIWHKEVE